MTQQKYQRQQWERRTLEALASLSHRAGELDDYLKAITQGVSQLIEVDWSVVTLLQDGYERVVASSLDMEAGEHVYDLHGTLTQYVVQMGQTLVVSDTDTCHDYGSPPEGYRSYLGVPLRPSHGEVIGTICSFHRHPREFDQEDIRIAELFAERAATAIDNHHLYQQVSQFNRLLETEMALRTQELQSVQAQLIQQERFAAIGQFASTIVHEVRNPLATVNLALQHFQKLPLSEASRERLSLAVAESARLDRLLSEILVCTKPPQLHLTRLGLNRLLLDLLDPLRRMPEAEQRHLRFSPAATEIYTVADADKLKQVVINLVRNAYEAVPAGAEIHCTVSLASADRAPQSPMATLAVHNDGPPIPPEVLPRLTELFYTSKPNGTGLGLAIVKRIVEAHRGTLQIDSTAEIGTTVTVLLPPCA
jgi:hypothetical protein